MSAVTYFELIGGAAGDMLLGALIDAGASPEAVEAALRTIPVRKPWHWRVERTVRRGIAAARVAIEVPGEDGGPGHTHDGRHGDGTPLRDVLAIVAASGLSDRQKERASAVYRRLGEAEARAHGESVDAIHFHEVGETDAILDVAGVCVALDLLGAGEVRCSAFPIGRGSVRMLHGTYPNPPPATAELLRGLPTYDGGVEGEMVTTTGAAILSTIARAGERPAMIAERIGYGAGASDFAIPNVVRASVGTLTGDGAPDENVVVLEANIDDMPPSHFELAIERLFAAGALDVWLASVYMKKSRPGFVLSAIAPPEREADCAAVMLAQTTTLGVRVRPQRRYVAERRVDEVATPAGTIRVKTAVVAGRPRRTLEYDDVARVARAQGRPFAEVAAELEKMLPPP